MKTTAVITSLLVLMGLSATLTPAQDSTPATSNNTVNKLTKLWATPQELRVPESVLYDPARDVLYVSNINGKPTEKNGAGFISQVALDGTILNLKWIVGLNAPKGSAIHKDKLYIADIDSVVIADIKTGRVVSKMFAPKAEFLNDVTVDKSGNIYISDMSEGNSVVYRLAGDKLSVWLGSDRVNTPNGLFVEGELLWVGSMNETLLKAFKLSDRTLATSVDLGSGVDGLVSDGEGNFLFSDWSGKTFLVEPSGKVVELLNTADDNIQSADITYIPQKKLVLIPTFFDNRVAAYKLERK